VKREQTVELILLLVSAAQSRRAVFLPDGGTDLRRRLYRLEDRRIRKLVYQSQLYPSSHFSPVLT
jgi:hypothetical protein